MNALPADENFDQVHLKPAEGVSNYKRMKSTPLKNSNHYLIPQNPQILISNLDSLEDRKGNLVVSLSPNYSTSVPKSWNFKFDTEMSP